jgi:hypothetical protein
MQMTLGFIDDSLTLKKGTIPSAPSKFPNAIFREIRLFETIEAPRNLS